MLYVQCNKTRVRIVPELFLYFFSSFAKVEAKSRKSFHFFSANPESITQTKESTLTIFVCLFISEIIYTNI